MLFQRLAKVSLSNAHSKVPLKYKWSTTCGLVGFSPTWSDDQCFKPNVADCRSERTYECSALTRSEPELAQSK